MSATDLIHDIASDEIDEVIKALQDSKMMFTHQQLALVRFMCIQSWMCGYELSAQLNHFDERMKGAKPS